MTLLTLLESFINSESEDILFILAEGNNSVRMLTLSKSRNEKLKKIDKNETVV